MRGRIWILFATLLTLSTPMFADTTYTYTGNAFTNFNDPVAGGGTYNAFTGGAIEIQFTLPEALAPNLTGYYIWPDISDPSENPDLSANIVCVSSSVCGDGGGGEGPYDNYDFWVSTNAAGDIIAWNMLDQNLGNGYISSTNLRDTALTNPDGSYASSEGPGTWTITPTPEPSSFVLLGTGILGLAGAARRKFLCV